MDINCSKAALAERSASLASLTVLSTLHVVLLHHFTSLQCHVTTRGSHLSKLACTGA